MKNLQQNSKTLPDYYVLSFSGGKDSTALCIEYLARRQAEPELYPLDEVMYCDTTVEFPQMLSHIEKVKGIVENNGVKFTRLAAEHDFKWYMFDCPNKKKDVKGFGWPGVRVRWCSARLKIKVANEYLKPIKEQNHVIHLLGYAADEVRRVKRKEEENWESEEYRFPLVEWGWAEADCLSYCYSKGFDWGGLYEIFKRVSCWCCPLQSLASLRALRTHLPDLWDELKEMDRKSRYQFRPDYSVDQLESRFQLEEERLKQGLTVSPYSKDFQRALKDCLSK